MDVSTHPIGDTVVRLAISGEIDLATVAALEKAVGQALTRPGLKVLIADFADVTFCDSTGIAMLDRGYAAANRLDIAFHLINESPLVRCVMQLVGTLDPLT